MRKKKKLGKMKMLRHVALSCLLALGLLTIVGTGGGGGGGGTSDNGGGGGGGITYTGLTTPATIDANNAQLLLADIFDAGDIAFAFGNFLGAVQDSSASENQVNLVKLSKVLEDALLRVDFSSGSPGTYQGAVKTESGTEPDDCGIGNFTYNVSYDDQTGAFNGTFAFNNFCTDAGNLSGTITISGTLNPADPNLPIISFLFEFSSLTVTLGSDVATLNGSIAGAANGNYP